MAIMTVNHSGRLVIKRLLQEHIAKYRKKLFFALFCMLVVAFATAFKAWLIQPALDQIFIEKSHTMLLVVPLAVFFVSLIGALANYGNILFMRYIGQRIVADMQIRLFTHLINSDIGLFHEQSPARLVSRFTNDINLLKNAFSNVITTITKESLSMVFLIGLMIYQNAVLAGIALIAFPTAIYPIIRLGKKMRRISDRTQHETGNFTAILDEIFNGIRTVKSYNREKFETSRTKSIIELLFRLYYKSARTQSASSPLMEILSGVSIALVIWYGGAQVMEGEITAGAFFSFITAFLMAYRPVRSMAGLTGVMQEGVAAANRLFNLLDTPPVITDAKNAKELIIEKGNICFENVSFGYFSGDDAIKNINLEIPAGKTAALVGLSGSGKSTLMNLLLRFYEVSGGAIKIDGQDIREVMLNSLRSSIAFVPQESFLFDDTIKANIAYGKEDSSDSEISAAAINAAADNFIKELPEGYETIIGAYGVKLSGGQRQRIAIARAMLKDAPILLLDEATSSLDSESERSVQQSLTKLMKGRTTLVIAHRLSTIVNADIIYVMENGSIIESGNHESLMAKAGKYYQLYSNNFDDC